MLQSSQKRDVIKMKNENEKPREKFQRLGANALSKVELLAIIIGSGIRGINVIDLSKSIIKQFGNKLLDMTVEDLKTIKGVGNIKAKQIISALTLGKRCHEEKYNTKDFIQGLKEKGTFNYEQEELLNNFAQVAEDGEYTLFDFFDIEIQNNTEKEGSKFKLSFNYIDLFSGAGGFSLGFNNRGFNNIFALEIEKEYCDTYKSNFPKHKLIKKDIKDLSVKEIKGFVGNKSIDVIIGGPPCQGFSIAGNIGRQFIDDPRNHLFKEFVRVVNIIKPTCFVMENVARLYTHNNGDTRNEIISQFEHIGYNVECQVLNSADYEVPQIRKRVLFIGVKGKGKIKIPTTTDQQLKTVYDALNDLPVLASGEKSNICNHIAMNHSDQMLEKMGYISDGGNRLEIPIEIRPKTGDVRKYIKYDSCKPSVTVTGDMRKIFHYSQNRALTVRELARLQTFPDNFIFRGTSISQQQQVGNAVPPLMAEAIAYAVKEFIIGTKKNEPNKLLKDINKFPKINFIGNKEKLVDWIFDYLPSNINSIFDGFSGGNSIGFEAKKRGLKVISNDILTINYHLSKALIENNRESLTKNDIDIIFSGVPFKGFMHGNYANTFFFENECMELDLYRKNIYNLSSEYKKSLALILLRRAMIRKMPYSRFNIPWNKIQELRDEEYSYKKYKRKRAYHNKSFKYHFLENIDSYNKAVFDNTLEHKAYNEDIFSLLDNIKTDVIYLDPPYSGTMNNYYSFYNLIDEYIESKKISPFKNNFIDKLSAINLFDRLFSHLSNYKYWLLSYNNNSHPSKEELLYLLGKYASDIRIIEKQHTYKVTGKENKEKNKEYLFIVKNC